jgi:hypothetical protein
MRLKQDGWIVVDASSMTHRMIATQTERAAK